MNRENKLFLGGCLSLALSASFVFYLCVNAKRTLAYNIQGSGNYYYILLILVVINVFFAVKSKKYFAVYVASLIVFFIWFSFADTWYSPIDEIMNFENINHIVANNRLTTFEDNIDYVFLNKANDGVNAVGSITNYEAVQAPLYYILFAAVGKFISNAYVRLHVFRLISLFLVFIIYFFVEKTVCYLEENGIIQINHQIYRIGLLITIFNPGYLYRASRLNNEILVCVLMSILLYISIRCVVEGYRKNYYWIISLLCVSLFLTKNTAIYAYIIFGAIVLFQKRVKDAIIPTVSGAVLTIPWFLFNYFEYGSLTAMKQHLDFVIPIVNPSRANVDLFDAFFNILPVTFFSAEEVAYPTAEVIWMGCFVIFLMILILGVSELIVGEVKNNKWELQSYKKKTVVNIICVALILACFLCLLMGTVSTKVCSIRGRYFYGPSIAIIILMVVNGDILSNKIKNYLGGILTIIIAIAVTRGSVTFINKVYTNENLYASEVEEYELCDISDENWHHGYSKTGNYLLVEITDRNSADNFQALVGHLISNGNQTAFITGISEMQEVGENKYVWLQTNKHLDSELVEDNVIQVGAYCSVENYNTYAVNAIVDNIEEKCIAQSIKMSESGEIYGYEIMLGTYGIGDYSAKCKYGVSDATGKELESGTVDIAMIKDNLYTRIYFDNPMDVKKDEEIVISLFLDNANDLPIAAYISNNDSYPAGSLYIDGVEMNGQDLGIKILKN